MRVVHPESRVGFATVQDWNRVGVEEDLFKPTPPHNLVMPSWSEDQTLHLLLKKIIYSKSSASTNDKITEQININKQIPPY